MANFPRMFNHLNLKYEALHISNHFIIHIIFGPRINCKVLLGSIFFNIGLSMSYRFCVGINQCKTAMWPIFQECLFIWTRSMKHSTLVTISFRIWMDNLEFEKKCRVCYGSHFLEVIDVLFSSSPFKDDSKVNFRIMNNATSLILSIDDVWPQFSTWYNLVS